MQKEINRIKKKIALVLYIGLFIPLIISELINSFFNNRFDNAAISLSGRIAISFKPTVILLYLVFTTLLMFLILRYLKPLFDFHTRKFKTRESREKAYTVARKAVIGMPRAVIIFQISVWVFATTLYYALKGWEADSGIPFSLGLIVKVASGILGALYVVFFINLFLIPIKNRLKIIGIRPGERDTFAIRKDYFAVLVASFYIFSQMSYLGWYFSQSGDAPTLGGYMIPVYVAGVILFLLASGPVFLSKREFHIQVKEILKEMGQIEAENLGAQIEPIYITNFDYLGDLAAKTNQVVKRFTVILNQVNSAVNHLSGSSQELREDSQANAAATNGQAAAVAEVVATMEDSDRLSKQMGVLAEEVEDRSQANLEKVSQGMETLKQYLKTMEQLKISNNRAIDFVFSLNENIKTIMDVSTIIKAIADQVKIIAFNAELEAAAAGEAGKNFEIVASEVRRLADNTVNAATEIRDKINFIEKESKNLYEASQETTQLIDTGWNLSQATEQSFQGIQKTSTETSKSAMSISENIQLQIGGFEQILLTMKEISATSQDVSRRTQTTAETVRSLEKLVRSLEELATREEERV